MGEDMVQRRHGPGKPPGFAGNLPHWCGTVFRLGHDLRRLCRAGSRPLTPAPRLHRCQLCLRAVTNLSRDLARPLRDQPRRALVAGVDPQPAQRDAEAIILLLSVASRRRTDPSITVSPTLTITPPRMAGLSVMWGTTRLP